MESFTWTNILNIIGWTGGVLFTGLFLGATARYLVSLVHDGLGRTIVFLNTLLVLTLWGIIGALWLLATGTVQA